MIHTYNPDLEEIMDTIDQDNGQGYNKNIAKRGQIFKLSSGTRTMMLYEVKTIEKVKVIFIRYVHYDSEKELLNLLAFAARFWMNLEANMVYYREKDRRNPVGKYLSLIGFSKKEVINDLSEFVCKRDGWPCKCKVTEYYVAGVSKPNTKSKATKPKTAKKTTRTSTNRTTSRVNKTAKTQPRQSTPKPAAKPKPKSQLRSKPQPRPQKRRLKIGT